jgi:hypothetical protein
MMEEKKTEKIKVYCPEHQTDFDAEKNSDIYCQTGKHYLAKEFPPKEDYWEYCCSCQRFMPLSIDEQVKNNCVCCERKFKNRHFCYNCNTLINNTEKSSKNNKYRVDKKGNLFPECPSCGSKDSSENKYLHDCDVLKVKFFTSRNICKFCGNNAQNQTELLPSNSESKELETFEELLPDVESIILENPNFIDFQEVNTVQKLNENDKEFEEEEITIVSSPKPLTPFEPIDVTPVIEVKTEENQVVANEEVPQKILSTNYGGCFLVLGIIFALCIVCSIFVFNKQPNVVQSINSQSNINVNKKTNTASNGNSKTPEDSGFRYNSKIILSGANLSEDPDYNSYTVTSVSLDTKIRVIDRKSPKSPWYKIKTELGDEGWIHGDYIDTINWSSLPCKIGEIGFISGGNLRSSAQHSLNEANVLAIWDNGTKVKIIDSVKGEPGLKTGNPNWYKIEILDGTCSFDTRNISSKSGSCQDKTEGYINSILVNCDK